MGPTVNTILELPGLFITMMMTIAGIAAFLGPHNGPPPSASGVLTPAAELQLLLRKGTPYAARAAAWKLARSPLGPAK